MAKKNNNLIEGENQPQSTYQKASDLEVLNEERIFFLVKKNQLLIFLKKNRTNL